MSHDTMTTAPTTDVDDATEAPKASAPRRPVSVESVAHSALDVAERAAEKAQRALDAAAKKNVTPQAAAPAPALPPPAEPDDDLDDGDVVDRVVVAMFGDRRRRA